MSKISLKAIQIPKGVSLRFEDSVLFVEGEKGVLSQRVNPGIDFTIREYDVAVVCPNKGKSKKLKALHGLYRSLLNNMLIGVSSGYTKRLELVGVGYRVQQEGRVLHLSLGYSHVIKYRLPENVECKIAESVSITLTSFDKQLLGQVAASIRGLCPPEPYKKKGIRYSGELIRGKAGKAAKSK